MNIACGECRSVFRVDPARIPAGGVRARCSVCGGVILIAIDSANGSAAHGQPTAAHTVAHAVAHTVVHAQAAGHGSFSPGASTQSATATAPPHTAPRPTPHPGPQRVSAPGTPGLRPAASAATVAPAAPVAHNMAHSARPAVTPQARGVPSGGTVRGRDGKRPHGSRPRFGPPPARPAASRASRAHQPVGSLGTPG